MHPCHCQPTNILVNKNLELKICDLGFARTTAPLGPHDVNLSREAVTQYWRAPEVELSVGGYTQALGKRTLLTHKTFGGGQHSSLSTHSRRQSLNA